MLLKFVATAFLVGIAWVLLSRGTRRAGLVKRRSRPAPPSETLIRCPRCNAYRLPGAPCDCRDV